MRFCGSLVKLRLTTMPSLLLSVLLSVFPMLLWAAEWQTGPGYRSIDLEVAKSGKPGFSLLSAAHTGILFSNTIPESVHLTNQILLDGSGVAAGDVDGDGRCDLYFCAINGRNTLYRNLGNWKF